MAGCSIRIYLRTDCIIGAIMMEAFRAVWMAFTSFSKGLITEETIKNISKEEIYKAYLKRKAELSYEK